MIIIYILISYHIVKCILYDYVILKRIIILKYYCTKPIKRNIIFINQINDFDFILILFNLIANNSVKIIKYDL